METIDWTGRSDYGWSFKCQNWWYKKLFWQQKQELVEHDQWAQRYQGNSQGKTQKKTGTQRTQTKEKTVEIT